MVSAEKIKSLRDKTGISIMICKKALESAEGDEARAFEWLKKQGMEMAESKSQRTTKAGLIEAYIHSGGRVGVMLELKSETDFVSKNPLFKETAHNVAMHIAAASPENVEALLQQPYIKDASVTVGEYLNSIVQKFGEKIELSRFER
ncbi:MAG: translation elongation factor Ts, partial [bacterium]|nr:translation elongation factor Ts [bacterium]